MAVLVSYPMVQIACAAGLPLLVHLVRWTATVVALAATLTGYRTYRRALQVSEGRTDRERIQRVAFTGFTGMLLSASGALLLIVEGIAIWVIDPCL